MHNPLRNEHITQHALCLDNIVNHINLIGENRHNVRWIMREGIWFLDQPTFSHRTFCDLIIAYDTYAVPVELKGSKCHADKAKEQVQAGREFIKDILKLQCPYGKLVVYSAVGDYWHRRIQWQ
jgi:hypothetical protein